MKAPLLIALVTVVLLVGSSLAIMNSACKNSHHGWCAPMSDIRHHVKIGLKLVAAKVQICFRWL